MVDLIVFLNSLLCNMKNNMGVKLYGTFIYV